MVSYYSPVTMFGHSGTGHYHAAAAAHHHHHHQSAAGSNPYFSAAAAAAAAPYGTYPPPPPPHSHLRGSSASPGSTTSAAGMPVTSGGVPSTAQYSPKIQPDFNYNHQYPSSHHQFPTHHPHMSPESIAGTWSHHGAAAAVAAAAAAGNVYNSSLAAAACHRNYTDDWTSAAAAMGGGARAGQNLHHHSFYTHQQPSPPSSNPSPNHLISGFGHNGGSVVQHGQDSRPDFPSESSAANTNVKVEFGQVSSGGDNNSISQENIDLRSRSTTDLASTHLGAPHSPDSGMAISDGVSSSGSPAHGLGANNGSGGGHNCGYGEGSSTLEQMASPSTTTLHNNNDMLDGTHGQHHIKYEPNTNPNQQSLQHRPTPARSPYEWMKKPAYTNVTTSNAGKTRTKDKYRVVYSDNQRVELEKEFYTNRYITIRRKAELAQNLELSERQVKIWFQNRRAKERKVNRKHQEMTSRDHMAHAHAAVHMNMAAVSGIHHISANYG